MVEVYLKTFSSLGKIFFAWHDKYVRIVDVVACALQR